MKLYSVKIICYPGRDWESGNWKDAEEEL